MKNIKQNSYFSILSIKSKKQKQSIKQLFILALFFISICSTLYTQDFRNQLNDDTMVVKPDYRNHINIPEYDPSLMPLDRFTTGTGVWTEVNPKVPRVDYLGIHFRDTLNGWAVGAQGAIIYSNDGGEKWQSANSPITNTLINVQSFNSQIIIAGGFDRSIIRSTDSGFSWQIIQTGGVGNLWETEIINDSTAFMCGTNSTLLKTTNYGVSWQPINTGINLNYWAIDFIDQQIGFIACDSGKILKTNDGGITWNLINTGFNKHLYRIEALSTNHIVAGGEAVLYTFDGGSSWNASNTGGPVDAMAFINENIGFISAYSQLFMKKTTDGGQSWQSIIIEDIGDYCLTFVNDSIGFNAGLDLVIKKTTDGGNTWNQKIIKDSFLNIWSISEDIAFALGSVLSKGVVYKTTDAGLNWNPSLSYEQEGFNSVFFIDSLTGFVGTSNNVRIYKTTDAGETWASKTITGITNFTEPIYDIYFVNKLNGFACTGGGAFIKTTDGGENWFATADNVYGIAVQFFDSLTGYVLSGTLKKTTDGGYSWTLTPLPELVSSSDFYFNNITTGWFSGSHNLYFTENAGTNWNLIFSNSGFWYGTFNWLDEDKAFITGGKTYYTNDTGNTWIDITNDVGLSLTGMHSCNVYSGYAIGSLGLIVKYLDTSYVPVELTSFNVQSSKNNCLLQWVTASELNNKGFYLERKKENDNYESIGFVSGNGTTTEKNEYLYIDLNLGDGLYHYRLKQVDFDGTYKYSNEVMINILTSPELFELNQNYPNPFNPETKITFRTGKNGNAKLNIYSLLGEKIKTLFNNYVEAGKNYEVRFEADDLSTGFYIYELVQYDKREVRKMLFLK